MGLYDSIVITGGGGMLAHDLVEALRGRGFAPVAVRRAECDITQIDQVAHLFDRYQPTLLLNCAAHTGVDLAEDEPDRAHAINGDALTTISKYCCLHGTRLVHFSTDFVFDGQIDRPYRPNDLTNPLSIYGKSKLRGELNVTQISPPSWLIIRTSWLFGRHGPCFPQTVLKLARSGRPLRIVQDQRGCPTYSVDLANATLNLVDKHATGIMHVSNAGPTNWYEFAAACLEEFDVTGDCTPLTTEQWLEMRPKQARRPSYSALDSSDYAVITGEPTRHWRDALRQYHAETINLL